MNFSPSPAYIEQTRRMREADLFAFLARHTSQGLLAAEALQSETNPRYVPSRTFKVAYHAENVRNLHTQINAAKLLS